MKKDTLNEKIQTAEKHLEVLRQCVHSSPEQHALLVQAEEERQRAEELARTLEQERDTLQVIMESTHAQLAYLDPQYRTELGERIQASPARCTPWPTATSTGCGRAAKRSR